VLLPTIVLPPPQLGLESRRQRASTDLLIYFGNFRKVESWPGPPGGRAKGYREFAQVARDVSMEGIKVVLKIARTSKDEGMRLAARKLLFERGFRKPVM